LGFRKSLRKDGTLPYIPNVDRNHAQFSPRTPGELNYAITRLLVGYVGFKGKSYTSMNDCLGALTGATLEMYRRMAVPYENEKQTLNGDVY
jgi:hypothetical protein